MVQTQYKLWAQSSAGVESNKPQCQVSEKPNWNLCKSVKNQKSFYGALPKWSLSPLTPSCLSFRAKPLKAWQTLPMSAGYICFPFAGLLCNYWEMAEQGENPHSLIWMLQSRLASSLCRCCDSSRPSSLEATTGRASKEQPALPGCSSTRIFLQQGLFFCSWDLSMCRRWWDDPKSQGNWWWMWGIDAEGKKGLLWARHPLCRGSCPAGDGLGKALWGRWHSSRTVCSLLLPWVELICRGLVAVRKFFSKKGNFYFCFSWGHR